MSTPSIPDPKRPPRKFVDQAKRERARRKACHGDWTPCDAREEVPDDRPSDYHACAKFRSF